MKSIADRYQHLFPGILQNIYDAKKFLFRHTDTQRTKASLQAFVEGLFGPNSFNHIDIPPVKENDKLLKVRTDFLYKFLDPNPNKNTLYFNISAIYFLSFEHGINHRRRNRV